MIIERKEERDNFFKSLEIGQTFTDNDNILYIKISDNYEGEYNAFNLCINESHYFYRTDVITPIKCKIVEI